MTRESFVASEWFPYDAGAGHFVRLKDHDEYVICSDGLLRFFDVPKTRRRMPNGKRERHPACEQIQFRLFAKDKPGRLRVDTSGGSLGVHVTQPGSVKEVFVPIYPHVSSVIHRLRQTADGAGSVLNAGVTYVECWYKGGTVPPVRVPEAFVVSQWYEYAARYNKFMDAPDGMLAVCVPELAEFFAFPHYLDRAGLLRSSCARIQFRLFKKYKPGRLKVRLQASREGDALVYPADGEPRWIDFHIVLNKHVNELIASPESDSVFTDDVTYVELWYEGAAETPENTNAT